MIFQIFLISFGVIGAYYHFFMKKKYNLPPGPRGVPVFGNMFALSSQPYKTYTQWQRDWGDIFYVKFGPINAVVVSDVKLIRECFNESVFNGRSSRLLLTILSRGKHGILSAEGSEWVEQRRFSLRHMRDFGFGKNYMETLIMDEVTEFLQWAKHEEGNPVGMQNKFELAVINSLWFIMTGKKFKQDDAKLLHLLREIDDNFMKPSLYGSVKLFLPSLLKLAPELLGQNKIEDIAQRFHDFLREAIQEHQDTLPADGNPRDFIDAYLHEIERTNDGNSSFYKEDGITSLLAVIGDMFFAGTETTSATLAWAMLYLAVNPNVQQKLEQEIDTVVGKSRPVSLQDRANMPYAEATVQEIFRKSSIAYTGVMHTAMEDATFGGYDIPKDTWIVPNIYAIHHNQKIWGDPDNFRPERFLEDDGKTIKKFEHFLPFSLGKRNCIGELLARDSIFLFLTNIFQRFSVVPDPAKPTPGYDAKKGFILQPLDFNVILTDRLA